MSMSDSDKIAFTIILVGLLAAAAFALGIFVRRLTGAWQPTLLETPMLIEPIGFVHFRSR